MTVTNAAKKVLPKGTRRRKMAAWTVGRVKRLLIKPPGISYEKWITDIEPLTISKNTNHKYIPKISIVIPAYNTPDKYLIPMIDSILNQTYENWELCIADGSTSKVRSTSIKKQAARDDRIKLVEVSENLGISGNTNMAIKIATGDFIAFMDHDDLLAEFALNEVVSAINKDQSIELFYSDEDYITENGKKRLLPYFKPDWSPELFLSANYMAHFVVVKSQIIKAIGGLRPEFDGAQDYDLLLRITEKKPVIYHIPKILYHWRQADDSTAKNMNTKSYADDSGKKAIKEYIKRNNIAADVLSGPDDLPTNYRIKYKIIGSPKVSIIIPFKDKAELLKVCVASIIKKSSYQNFEIILVDNNSQEPGTTSYLNKIGKHKNIHVIEYNKPFNYSAVNNFGRKQASGELLLFMNNDMKVINDDWLEELIGVAIQPEIGAVGGFLFYPDRKIQHAGVIVGMTGTAAHVFRQLKPHTLTFYRYPDWVRNYLAVTGACLMVRASTFDKVGGFDERFIICGSDVALGLSLHESGYRNVFTPYAKLFHYESQSVGSYNNIPPSDYDLSMVRYKKYLEGGDPYYNPNLEIMSETPTPAGTYGQ